MIETIKNYNSDFWINDTIVDCSSATQMTLDLSYNYVITMDECELKELGKLEEKLNKKCKHKQNQHINESPQNIATNRKHKNVKDRNIERVYITCAENKIDQYKTTCRRMHKGQTPPKHNNIHTTANPNYYKRHMHTLCTNSRVYDFKSADRKVLLEPCPKPGLNIKN
jgi:hypothetical protein